MHVQEIMLCGGNRARLVVRMPDINRCTTDKVPHIIPRIFALFPTLAGHRCRNGRTRSFRKECEATEIPHLLEHLIIELQFLAQPHRVLKGETEWDWKRDPLGTFVVEIDYENEYLVLAAIRLAERVLKAIDCREIDTLDMDREIERLRQIARLGRGEN